MVHGTKGTACSQSKTPAPTSRRRLVRWLLKAYSRLKDRLLAARHSGRESGVIVQAPSAAGQVLPSEKPYADAIAGRTGQMRHPLSGEACPPRLPRAVLGVKPLQNAAAATTHRSAPCPLASQPTR